jgi:hypothetical protein
VDFAFIAQASAIEKPGILIDYHHIFSGLRKFQGSRNTGEAPAKNSNIWMLFHRTTVSQVASPAQSHHQIKERPRGYLMSWQRPLGIQLELIIWATGQPRKEHS